MRMSAWITAALSSLSAASAAQAQPACPSEPVRVVRSAGGVVDYLGSVPGIPDLCHIRRGDGEGDFYLGAWRSDWPGAGQAYPAMKAAIAGGNGTRTSFITRSYPGLQWTDSFRNEGMDTVQVGGVAHRVLRLSHERAGIEGNTYHSVITFWSDVATGAVLRVMEYQISGQSYGPDTSWTATAIQKLPRSAP